LVGSRIDAVLSVLAENPGLGRKTRRSKIRFMNTHPYPYLIFYRVSAEEVEVIAIRHGARNPRSMPARPR
jgi:toxin ParE1/3/4